MRWNVIFRFIEWVRPKNAWIVHFLSLHQRFIFRSFRWDLMLENGKTIHTSFCVFFIQWVFGYKIFNLHNILHGSESTNRQMNTNSNSIEYTYCWIRFIFVYPSFVRSLLHRVAFLLYTTCERGNKDKVNIKMEKKHR